MIGFYVRAGRGIFHIDCGNGEFVHVKTLGEFAKALVGRKLGISREKVSFYLI